ncbi:TetR/AcrR family transcriptional regulator [Rhizobium sp. Rhizsp82]|uniref:TetR/AcrR family transcriptional regulator n=1 Tax=Rhizobium sp. Rhizsp82 TaxID=3243057 RepID=UPI0039B56744
MVQNAQPVKRPRGRPQTRCDEDTREVIVNAACCSFREGGYEATSVNAIAQVAGVSTKTLYRLFPSKTDLFSAVVSVRIDDFLLRLDIAALAGVDVREGLERMLRAYGELTLSERTVTLLRLIVSESERFPEIATAFYEKAIDRTNDAMEAYLRSRVEAGEIILENPHIASGMLRGMMIMEPQRSALLGQTRYPTAEEIRARAKMCVEIFLEGVAGRRGL